MWHCCGCKSCAAPASSRCGLQLPASCLRFPSALVQLLARLPPSCPGAQAAPRMQASCRGAAIHPCCRPPQPLLTTPRLHNGPTHVPLVWLCAALLAPTNPHQVSDFRNNPYRIFAAHEVAALIDPSMVRPEKAKKRMRKRIF
jgi:hypothetical protein